VSAGRTSIEKYDRGARAAHFRKLPSLQEHMLIAQDQTLVERYVRQPDGDWLLTEFNNMTQTFAFATISARVGIAEIYRGIEFPENPGR
jgi:hypothetical protein